MLGNLVWDHASLYGIFVEKGALSRLHNPYGGIELSDFSPHMHYLSSGYLSPLHNHPWKLSLGARGAIRERRMWEEQRGAGGDNDWFGM